MKEKFISFAKRYYLSIEHPLAVASSFEELSDEWIVGLFHDLLEDTDLDRDTLLEFLSEYGKSSLFVEIENITRKHDETYFDYIRRLSGIAKIVKIADLKQNLSRVKTLTESLKSRYVKALHILNNC